VTQIGGHAVTVVGAQLRCVDAAREGARAAARGEDLASVRALVLRAAPDGVTVSVGAEIGEVDVAVRITRRHDDLETGHSGTGRIGAVR